LLGSIKLDGAEIYVEPVREHRFLFVIRAKNLSEDVTDTDPQKTGVSPLHCNPKAEKSRITATYINNFIYKASQLLANKSPANMIVLRGFSRKPDIPSLQYIYKLNPAVIARYPMYKGLAKLVGMKIYDINGDISEQIKTLKSTYNDHDFFFFHIKETDSSGEDGDYQRKVNAIEKVDKILPDILELNPDVIVITGDHSTPAVLKGHSWHPIPSLVYSKWCRPDQVTEFTESACIHGGLGNFLATDILPLAMANALKFTKFGA
jgi:2,3-bisphosphoglycerate-independent phosphoglycerate mutase